MLMTQNMIDSDLWYVVHTRPHKELLAAGMLEERLSLQVYLPEVLQKYREQMVLRPLFPRYVFVQANLSKVEVTAINATPGTLKIIVFGDIPLPLRPGVMAQLRVEVDKLNEEGGLPHDTYRPGEMVRLNSGPLKGLHALFVKHLKPVERVVVLLRFLGQQNEVELDLHDIERASPVHHHKKRRGTRGGGRKIDYQGKEEPKGGGGG